jgi:hypothetical protein
MPRRSNRRGHEPSLAGTGGFTKVKKPVVTLKIELPPMGSVAAYEKALELAKKLNETDASPYRIKAVSVTN